MRGRNPYLRKPEPTRRPKDTGAVRRSKYGQRLYEAYTPHWAGAVPIGEPQSFKFRAEQLLERWLRENPRPAPCDGYDALVAGT